MGYWTDYYTNRDRIIVRAMELGLPIPYTGKRGGGHMYRRNRFLPIARAAAAAEVDDRCEGYHIRGRIRVPRNPWDDIPISAWDLNNWKRHRRTQWRGK